MPSRLVRLGEIPLAEHAFDLFVHFKNLIRRNIDACIFYKLDEVLKELHPVLIHADCHQNAEVERHLVVAHEVFFGELGVFVDHRVSELGERSEVIGLVGVFEEQAYCLNNSESAQVEVAVDKDIVFAPLDVAIQLLLYLVAAGAIAEVTGLERTDLMNNEVNDILEGIFVGNVNPRSIVRDRLCRAISKRLVMVNLGVAEFHGEPEADESIDENSVEGFLGLVLVRFD